MKIKFSIILLPLLLFVLIPVIIAESNIQGNSISTPTAIQKIAFVSKRDGNSEIYTINDDGTDLKRLTHGKTDAIMPQWSPDGAKFLYILKKGNKNELWIMKEDGGNPVKLAEECATDYPPLWSPDSSKILFMAKFRSTNAIFTVNSDGNGLVRLTENGLEGSSLSWFPDGSKILFLQKRKDDINMYVINPDGTGRLKLTRETGAFMMPTLSTDGRKIAYIYNKQSFISSENKLYIMNVDGSNSLSIADVSKKVQDIVFQDDFCWSPDGTNIAFTKVAQAEAHVTSSGNVTFTFIYGTYIVSADGNSNEYQLATTGETRAYPAWSPDSSKVAYLSSSKLKIYTVKSGTENTIRVNATLPLSLLHWSPDGKKIIFAGKNSSFQKAGLYLVTLDGKVTQLSQKGDYDPTWAPMGITK
jgi:Tol biopolymer transport system component